MKGKLKKTEKGWFVEYDAELAGENIWVELLPVYYENWMLTSISLIEGGNVTFEKIIKPFDVNGVNDVTYCAKIIRSKSVVDTLKPYSDMMNSNWDSIIREFHLATQQVEKSRSPLIFECWLTENYNPPTKKQK